MIPSSFYDADYYERGIESGKSCYQNYQWLPELTIPMAMTLIDYLSLSRDDFILDFGCAKGFLVKALRLLYRQAYGVDTSKYAIQNSDPVVRKWCTETIPKLEPVGFDWIISKDVFEHINESYLPKTIQMLSTIGANLFVCVPLGNEKGFISPANNMDKSHIVCHDDVWWETLLNTNGWIVSDFTYRIPGIKDNYYEATPHAHGFFVCERN